MKSTKHLIRGLLGILLITIVFTSCETVDEYDPYGNCNTCKEGEAPNGGDRDTIISNINGNFIEVFGQRETDMDYVNILTDENESFNVILDQAPNNNSGKKSVLSKSGGKSVATNENFTFDSSSPKLYYDLDDLVFYWILWRDDNTQSLVVEMDSQSWLREPAIDRGFFFTVDYEIKNDGAEIVISYDNKYLHIIDGD